MSESYDVSVEEGGSFDMSVEDTIGAQVSYEPVMLASVTFEGDAEVSLTDETDSYSTMFASEGILPLDGSVTTKKLGELSVTTPKIADGAVTRPKIADGAVTDDKLDPSGVIATVRRLDDTVSQLDLTIDPDDLGLEQDEDTKYVYPTYRGVRSANGIPLAASGGGGGGGGGNNAILTVTNTTGWLSRTTVMGAPVVVSVDWSSIEDGMPTGDGSLTVIVGSSQVYSKTVEQGAIELDAAQWISQGSNKVKLRVADVYGNSRTITFSVNVTNLSITSSFDTSGTFAANTPIDYTYTPVGNAEKHVLFEVDGTVVATADVVASGRQQTQRLPGMSHGAHYLRVWLTANVDGSEVTSNAVTHALVVVSQTSSMPIVAVDFWKTSAQQYETLQIPYTVYTPGSLTSQVTLLVNDSPKATLTVDRTRQTWALRCERAGTLSVTVTSGRASKTVTVEVAQSDIDVDAETQGLALHMQSYGRSNNEDHPEVWQDAEHGISATLTGFTFTDSDGWVLDKDGSTVLRVAGGARATIPYQPFARDWRSTGRTLELEFATHDVADYSAVIVDCMSGGRGFALTAQEATLKSEQTTISTRFKEDEHVRISFVADKRTDDRLLYVYINGIISGVTRYPDDDDFSQVTPVGITIGADGCAVDVYHVRVYDNDLTRYQVLRNWVADSSSVDDMLARYGHNDVYDEYGQVVIDKLPTDLPYFVVSCPELPQYKGDKKTCSGSFTDPLSPSKSFTFDGCQINVQGTSSATYARKNYDLQFKGGFDMTQSGEHADDYQLDPSVKPFNRFVLKADVASSEGANNVELTMLYCDADPYKRPEERADPQVRKGIWGRPAVLFWHNTDTNETSFVGKVNFNLPKRAPVPYGYSGDMESWEFQNNTSDLMLFLTDHFDQTMIVDPATGEAKEGWRYDYEARFPEDTWTDYAKLQELQTFVYSTYRANATGATLATPYVDVDGIEHTVDDAAYRLAKFRTEFGKYAEVDSFIFYYIFTELFLMVDSRAKNLFIGFSGSDATGLSAIDRKAVAEPYDMDTSLGIEAA